MTYPETIQYLESFINYEKLSFWPYKESLKLERIKDFLITINNPQDSLRCIHIAGTKGKGSTCAFIAYILKEAGFKTGLYTSPHLSDFRERIRILSSQSLAFNPRFPDEFEGMISKKELTTLVEKLKPAIDKYNKSSSYGPLSFFEVYTALALVYFKEQKTDFVVLETGLGGRLDATNAVDALVCAITPISYEHTQKLGNTLAEIATEKAGIIKNSPPEAGPPTAEKFKIQNPVVISAPQEEKAIKVIRKKCQDVKAKLYEVGKDITCQQNKNSFKVKAILNNYDDLRIKLIGGHQIINAAVAMSVVEALKPYGVNVGIDAIRKGLYNTLWPGRCEVVSDRPLIVLDGAQNIASARVLKEAIRNNFHYKKLILILGVSKDKDIKGICNELYDLADMAILTKANNFRATEPKVLAEGFKGKKIYLTNSVAQAKDKALILAKKEDIILVCGSLFIVGEFRDLKK